MTDAKAKSWELFEECFDVGDDVIVVDYSDLLYWGRLIKATDHECVLEGRAYTKYLSWDDIRFICHDGFPVKKIKGDRGKTIEQLDTTNMQMVIRRELDKPQLTRTLFGDPFDVTEPVTSRLYHPGNSGPGYWSRFWDGERYLSEDHRALGYETEEVLVMEAKDGACAELWDLTTVFEFETEPQP